MHIETLKTFCDLVETGSFSKAAALNFVSQSAVSRALLSTEDKLGARLFERTVRGLAPTLAGQRLIDAAGPFLAQLADLETIVATSTDQTVHVRLVCECYTAYRWLPSALAKLRPNLPSLDVTLAVDHTNAPVAALLSGDADIALLTTTPVRGRLNEEPLFPGPGL